MMHKTAGISLVVAFVGFGLAGCAAHVEQQNAMLNECMERQIQDARYISGRTSPSQVVNISEMACSSEFYNQNIKKSHQPKMSAEQKAGFERLAMARVAQAPRYRFDVVKDHYKGIITVKGLDSIRNSGATENYYTEAILVARKSKDSGIRYSIEVLRSGMQRGEFDRAYFKNGSEIAATSVTGRVRCETRVFCFWSEGAIVEIPGEMLASGQALDFKLSGLTDSDPVQIPKDYIDMFMAEVKKAI